MLRPVAAKRHRAAGAAALLAERPRSVPLASRHIEDSGDIVEIIDCHLDAVRRLAPFDVQEPL
jgi:hypothetical protein